jgi:hypothetical protein
VVCITATIGTKRHKKLAWADCLLNDWSLRVPQFRLESKIERAGNGISFHNWHALLWDTVHIFSQERQTRGKRRRLAGSQSSSLCDSRFGYSGSAPPKFLTSSR